MKAFLQFLSGFFYNVVSMIITLIPMSYLMGMICVEKKKFFWEVDELELLEELDKGE